MVLQIQDKNSQTNSLNIDNKKFATTESVKLLGITIDSQLRFTAWKASKYGVFSGAYFALFGPEKTTFLVTFPAVVRWTYI